MLTEKKGAYHIWEKKRRLKRRVKKADRKKSDLFLIFRGKIRHFVFFTFFDLFFGRSRFFYLVPLFLPGRFFYRIGRFFYLGTKIVVLEFSRAMFVNSHTRGVIPTGQ